jgi:hypothetical protein
MKKVRRQREGSPSAVLALACAQGGVALLEVDWISRTACYAAHWLIPDP